jgi:hypothetical protein
MVTKKYFNILIWHLLGSQYPLVTKAKTTFVKFYIKTTFMKMYAEYPVLPKEDDEESFPVVADTVGEAVQICPTGQTLLRGPAI